MIFYWLAVGLAASGVFYVLEARLKQEIDFLARTMWGEARGEGETGMRAVGHVIFNRVNSVRYPNSVQGVVRQSRQFSAWNANDPNYSQLLAVDENNSQFVLALKIAEEILIGQSLNPIGDALHYHATYIRPYWADGATVVAVVGGHKFLTGVA